MNQSIILVVNRIIKAINNWFFFKKKNTHIHITCLIVKLKRESKYILYTSYFKSKITLKSSIINYNLDAKWACEEEINSLKYIGCRLHT